MRSIKVRLPTEILQVTGSVNGIEVPWTRNGDMWTATCSPSEDKTYHVQLKAINSLGAEFDYAFELYDGLRLITDRTKQEEMVCRYDYADRDDRMVFRFERDV